MRTNYVLIDFENVQPTSVEFQLLAPEHFRVMVFVGAKQPCIQVDCAQAIQQLGDRGQYVKVAKSGKNVLDFHLVYHLGRLVVHDPEGVFHIISKDCGYDSLLEGLRKQKLNVKRFESIGAIPMFARGKKQKEATADKESQPTIASCGVETVLGEPTVQAEVSITRESPALTDRIGKLLESLARRGPAVPRSEKALRNAIRALFNNDLDDEQIDAMILHLRSSGIISETNKRLEYPGLSGLGTNGCPESQTMSP